MTSPSECERALGVLGRNPVTIRYPQEGELPSEDEAIPCIRNRSAEERKSGRSFAAAYAALTESFESSSLFQGIFTGEVKVLVDNQKGILKCGSGIRISQILELSDDVGVVCRLRFSDNLPDWLTVDRQTHLKKFINQARSTKGMPDAFQVL